MKEPDNIEEVDEVDAVDVVDAVDGVDTGEPVDTVDVVHRGIRRTDGEAGIRRCLCPAQCSGAVRQFRRIAVGETAIKCLIVNIGEDRLTQVVIPVLQLTS